MHDLWNWSTNTFFIETLIPIKFGIFLNFEVALKYGHCKYMNRVFHEKSLGENFITFSDAHTCTYVA